MVQAKKNLSTPSSPENICTDEWIIDSSLSKQFILVLEILNLWMHNIRCGAISCSHDMRTHAEYMRVCFLVLPYSLNEMGRSDENSERMAGDEFCFEGVWQIMKTNRKTMEYEMSLSIYCRGMFGFLFLELMKVTLLRAPCSDRSKQRGIVFWSDSSWGITFLLSKVHLVSMPRGKLIFFL